MGRKAIFFDIDGTLIDFRGHISESTARALREAKRRGHYIFLCSGRSRCMIDSRLTGMEFDGYICSSGAYVEYQGKVLHRSNIERGLLAWLIKYFEKHNMSYMLQLSDKIVSSPAADADFNEKMKSRDQEDADAIAKMASSRVVDDKVLEHLDDYPGVEKACYHDADISLDAVKRDLADHFEITAMSFKNATDSAGEITIQGVNKAYGMQKLLDKLGLGRQDVIAFGDGPNDFEMIEFAGVGVAMGNASDELKRQADFVTLDVDNDGIQYGMEKLKLIS